MLTVQINVPTQDKQVITSLGTITLSENTINVGQHLYSRPTLSVSGVVISGLATDLLLDLSLSETCAENIMSFVSIPDVGDTVTLGNYTYTFIPAASGYISNYQVKLGSTTFGTALNFHKVLNAVGTAGVDFFSGQPANDLVETSYVNNPLVIKALTFGTAGNSIVSTTTASGIVLAFDTLYNGGEVFPNKVMSQTATWSGLGNYYFDPVSFHPTGTTYEGTATLYYNDEQLVNGSGIAVTYTLPRTKFYGKTTMNEFVEVPNISGIWEANGYADSSGKFYVTWDSPATVTYSGITSYLSAPATTGTPTQSTRTITAIDAVQPFEYNIFVYTGSTAPERAWPRPVDANGTWYWAGRTTKTYAQVTVPSNTKGIWVGYGNKYTYANTVTNLNQTSTAIYI